MAETPSNMIELGTIAPNFSLPDTVSGVELTYDQVRGENGTLVMFICNHCPYVIMVKDTLKKLGLMGKEKNFGVVAISSNDVENYPQDAPDLMTKTAKEWGFTFPYLYDESQSVAKSYDAACTPDIYLFNEENQLVYRGQLDSARPGNGIESTGEDLVKAIESMLSGQDIDKNQMPSSGCNIKWKK